MNIINFLEEFTTDNIVNKKSSRREAFSQFGSFGKKAAMTAIPFGLSALASRKAKASTIMQDDSATGALQLALTLEYLEAEFYNKSLDAGVLPSGRPLGVYKQIAKHENAHVKLLKGALGDNSIESPEFDFTVGGMFDPFNENGAGKDAAYSQLLALAQAFEDTGVRAYKGQAGNVMSDPGILTTALQIHSVEARHASEVRRLRAAYESIDQKGWITGKKRGAGMPEATQATYDGEENVTQGGVDVTTLGDGSPFSVDSSTEAYDETITGNQAKDIASLFIKS